MFTFMKTGCISLSLLACLVSSANGQASRTWVSGVGDDVNPCSRTAPCKTWAGAISKTAAGGEIDALDPGGFGAVTITKSIRIDGGPFTASALGSGANGIIINAGPADSVTLRGITVSGNNTVGAFRGIVVMVAGSVSIENCEIYGWGQRGISIQPTNNNATVTITDTNVKGNLGNGIVVQPAGLNSNVVLDRVHVQQNVSFGVSITGGSSVSIRNSVLSNNGASGLRMDGTGMSASADLDNVEIAGNATGIESIAGSITRVANSSIVQNSTGLSIGGTVQSFGNNRVAGNLGGNGGMSPIGLQ
jgi:hypothetical protein